jgi:hypothetical protein
VVALQSYLIKVGIQTELEFAETARMSQYLNGTWKNALLYHPLIEASNYNHTFNMYFGVPSSWFQSMKKPEGWKEMLTASMTSPYLDPVLLQKCIQAASDDVMTIPVYYGAAIWATNWKVEDTGLGERGDTVYWNPQNAWLYGQIRSTPPAKN